MFFKKNTALKAYADGKMIPITEVEDPVFSQKIMGNGLAIQPEGNTIYAPCDGKVTVTFDKTQHAVGIAMKNKMEILLHVGLDTVNLQEEIFHTLVKSGDDVKQGQTLITYNKERLYELGYSDVTMCVITDEGNAKNVEILSNGTVKAKETDIVKYK